MEIIMLLIFIVSVSSPFVMVILQDGQIMGRTVKVVKSNLNRHKQIVPGIVTADMLALEPRKKDWGPDGKLTQMWQDAFDYWQIENPQEVMASYRVKDKNLKEHKATLERTIELSDKLYHDYLNSRCHVPVHTASEARTQSRDARRKLAMVDIEYLRIMTPDERVMGRLAERYDSEVHYNNDMVRLSAQKNMPTFDYIALTSV